MTIDFSSNSSLIEHLQKGDEQAFMHLVDKYHRRLSAYVHALIDDHTMTEDIVQNVFLNTWQFRKKLNPKFSIQSFLFKSAYHEFLRIYHKNESMLQLQRAYYDALNDIVQNTDDSVVQELVEVVNYEIEHLPEKCQEVFVMSKREGLTNVEIAEYLRISVKAVEARITRSFSILREKLEMRLTANGSIVTGNFETFIIAFCILTFFL